MARDTREQAAAKKFLTAIHTLDFDAEDFAMTVLCESTATQNRVLDLLMTLVDQIVVGYRFVGFPSDPAEMELLVKARRMQEAMQPFRE